MNATERVDALERDLAAMREGLTIHAARVMVLEARLRHKENQIKWLRISRDNWKIRANERLKRLRQKSRRGGSVPQQTPPLPTKGV